MAKLVFSALRGGGHFENGRFEGFPVKIRLGTTHQSIPGEKYIKYVKFYILGTSSTVGQHIEAFQSFATCLEGVIHGAYVVSKIEN